MTNRWQRVREEFLASHTVSLYHDNAIMVTPSEHAEIHLSGRTVPNKAAQALGRKGGQATAKKRTKQQRSDAAKKAAQARWAKKDR